MDEIIEGEVARWIPVIIEFVFTNFFTLVLVLLLIILVLVVIGLGMKRSMTLRIYREAKSEQEEVSRQIDAIMTSDRFRELELGLAAGKTGQRLKHLQEEGFSLRQEALTLGTRLQSFRAPLFSLLSPFDEAHRLRDEVHNLARRLEQYDGELRSIDRMGDAMRSTSQQLRSSFDTVLRSLEALQASSGYPLETLAAMADEAEKLVIQAEQSAAFDALQARRDAEVAERQIHTVSVRVREAEQDIQTFLQMKERIQQREDQIRMIVAEAEQETHEDADAGVPSVEEVMQRITAVLAEVEAEVRSGKRVALREAAARIEDIIKQAASR